MPDVIVADLPYGDPSRSYSDEERTAHRNQPETSVFPRGGPLSAYVELLDQILERGWRSRLVFEIGRIDDTTVNRDLSSSEILVEIIRTQNNGFVTLSPRDF